MRLAPSLRARLAGLILLSGLTLLAATTLAAPAAAQGTATLVGVVVDGDLGETLIGANVQIEATTLGAVTDLDGRFTVRGIPAGTYTVVVSYIGYTTQRLTGVALVAGQTRTLDVTLGTDEVGLGEFVVEVRAVENTEASLLANRQRSLAVSDAISSEAIGRAGSNNVADAMQRVTGASIVGGRYVVVRGLGDRYVSTQLNGTELPSADPDRRSFQLDLIPSSLLDNVVTSKTFTPDKPGNFSGGAVDVTTKDYPERRFVTVSTSGAYDSRATGATILAQRGSATDWLGFDDGQRALPSALSGSPAIPSFQDARADPAKAAELDRLSRAFRADMTPTRRTARPNGSLSVAAGDAIALGGGRTLGLLGSLSYRVDASAYDDGQENRWYLVGSSQTDTRLQAGQQLSDTRGTEEATWGLYGTAALRLSRNHDVSLRLVSTQAAESRARTLVGRWPQELPSDDEFFESRALQFAERGLRSGQLRGRHAFGRRGDVTLDWRASLASTEQDEPDVRFFSNDFTVSSGDTTYNINRALYDEPTRFFRNGRETARTADVSVSVPLYRTLGVRGTFKAGLFGQMTDRRFREQRYSYSFASTQIGCPGFTYEGDAAAFFSEESIGITGQTATGRACFGNYIEDRTDRRNSYDGDGAVGAAFAMADAIVAPRLRLVGGVRMETTALDVASLDTSVASGRLRNRDLLPALGVIYEVRKNANLRVGYGRTLARPTFREFGPFASFDFIGDFLYEGNTSLKRTLIDNVDVRAEWFARPGDLYAVSLFGKRLENPIERVFDVGARRFTNRNVPEGRVYGAELEARRSVDLGRGRRLQPGLNLSLIRSFVDIDSTEAALIRADNPSADIQRPLFGQSPFLVNGELTYSDRARAVSVFYNVFGERLSEVVYGPTPDAYEQPRHSLDVTASQRLPGGVALRASAKNLLGARDREILRFNGQEYVYTSRGSGTTVSLGLSVTL